MFVCLQVTPTLTSLRDQLNGWRLRGDNVGRFPAKFRWGDGDAYVPQISEIFNKNINFYIVSKCSYWLLCCVNSCKVPILRLKLPIVSFSFVQTVKTLLELV